MKVPTILPLNPRWAQMLLMMSNGAMSFQFDFISFRAVPSGLTRAAEEQLIHPSVRLLLCRCCCCFGGGRGWRSYCWEALLLAGLLLAGVCGGTGGLQEGGLGTSEVPRGPNHQRHSGSLQPEGGGCMSQGVVWHQACDAGGDPQCTPCNPLLPN